MSAMNTEQKLNKEINTLFKSSAFLKRNNGGKKTVTYGEFLSDKMLMIDLINVGVPYSLFDLIQSVSPFSEGDWAAILDISLKSLQRYKQSAKTFKPLQSEKIVEVAEVTREGLEFFGDAEKFRRWLNTPSLALGKAKPKDLLKSSYGKELVLGELVRMEHGIFV